MGPMTIAAKGLTGALYARLEGTVYGHLQSLR